jgi:hypothetical protein
LSLRDVKGRIRPLFQQERMAVSAGLFLDALLGPERLWRSQSSLAVRVASLRPSWVVRRTGCM